MRIGFVEPGDWDSIRAIYLEGIASRQATFETEAPSWEAWNESHLQHPRLKATEASGVIGWAALSPVSHRQAYSGVAESGTKKREACGGKGVGKGTRSGPVGCPEES